MERILETPSLVQELWLEETNEACAGGGVNHVARLVCFEQVDPVLATFLILDDIDFIAQTICDLRDAEIVIAVLQGSRY